MSKEKRQNQPTRRASNHNNWRFASELQAIK